MLSMLLYVLDTSEYLCAETCHRNYVDSLWRFLMMMILSHRKYKMIKKREGLVVTFMLLTQTSTA